MICIVMHVMAGVQTQYKSMYPTKTWCNIIRTGFVHCHVGKMHAHAQHLPIAETDRIGSLLSSYYCPGTQLLVRFDVNNFYW